ncbi:tetratricopeptide repeat protein [Azospirillum sp.]|uniref:tetratricopeptide repeat protein n=1 Tax=Azospirillum sp. TaxID=34012 RepID=UPI002D68EAB7|nr:tetratricopeptide repeat protein [Azospirillum sp.]HYD66946.1 tetratricopeptide repeat protein [Azospirillum sp.]
MTADAAPADAPDARNDLRRALELHTAGWVGQAEALYRRSLTLDPADPDTLHMAGVLATQMGDPAGGIRLIRRSLAVRDEGQARYNLAVALKQAGRFDEALAETRAAVRLAPGFPQAHYNLGIALAERRQWREAADAYRAAIRLNPGYAAAYINIGNVLVDLWEPERAVAAYRNAIALDPTYPRVYSNMGNALREYDRFAEGFVAVRRALTLDPALAPARHNLGNAYLEQGRHADAATSYRAAIALTPDHAAAHLGLSLTMLHGGDFARGWATYEWRWKTGDAFLPPGPVWRGEEVAGKTVLLHAEQGFGDTLHFVRYAPMVAARGARVVLEVPGPLRRLLDRTPGLERVIAQGEPRPEYDAHCPLLSLPLAFGTRLETIPAGMPYLHADPAAVERWRARLAEDGALRVGLVWAGNPRRNAINAHAIDRRRSMRLEQFAPLAGVPGVRFVSLQKGEETAPQAKTPPAGMDLVDWMDEVGDFADTAALIANLDLVIGVDTSVIHLAGGLGKPVWMLSRYDACWRWLAEREDSPWYPTMRIFRQPQPGAWAPVVDRLADELRAWAGGRKTVA